MATGAILTKTVLGKTTPVLDGSKTPERYPGERGYHAMAEFYAANSPAESTLCIGENPNAYFGFAQKDIEIIEQEFAKFAQEAQQGQQVAQHIPGIPQIPVKPLASQNEEMELPELTHANSNGGDPAFLAVGKMLAENYIKAHDLDLKPTGPIQVPAGATAYDIAKAVPKATVNTLENATGTYFADNPIPKALEAVQKAEAQWATMLESPEKTQLAKELQEWKRLGWDGNRNNPVTLAQFANQNESVQDDCLNPQERVFAYTFVTHMPTIAHGIMKDIAQERNMRENYEQYLQAKGS